MAYKKTLFISSFLFVVISCSQKQNRSYVIDKDEKKIHHHLKESADQIRYFTKEHLGYNTKIAFLIDMSVFSGHNRFFVYDLKKDTIMNEGLVAHGKGSDAPYPQPLIFSNTEGSYCTSLGIYKVAESYVGDYGKSYKLYGLESTNSNAYQRSIVLHKYRSVPDTEQNSPICLSLGCPMVSYRFFEYLEFIIDNSTQNILLYIYTS